MASARWRSIGVVWLAGGLFGGFLFGAFPAPPGMGQGGGAPGPPTGSRAPPAALLYSARRKERAKKEAAKKPPTEPIDTD